MARVADLHDNSVTFVNVEYALTDDFVSNQDPRNHADKGSPEPSDTMRVFLLVAGPASREDRQAVGSCGPG